MKLRPLTTYALQTAKLILPNCSRFHCLPETPSENLKQVQIIEIRGKELFYFGVYALNSIKIYLNFFFKKERRIFLFHQNKRALRQNLKCHQFKAYL